MSNRLKKWSLRLAVLFLAITAVLVLIILKPALTYGNKTRYYNFTVYFGKDPGPDLLERLDEAAVLLKSSEFYNSDLHLDICLNNGSLYPKIIRVIRGEAFGWGFYNKVVLQGRADFKHNYVELNGYKWNLGQLLAHEMTHCMQYNELGLWGSKPFAAIENWKWEGYGEFIARQGHDQKDLGGNIKRLLDANKVDSSSWAISFNDGSIAPREYYQYWLLLQYCMHIKKMTYRQVLSSRQTEADVRTEMMQWYHSLNKQ